MNIKNEMEEKLNLFNRSWEKYLTLGIPSKLYEAAQHLPISGGKRIRPILAMTSCESVNGNINNVLPFAAAVELLHNFTLVHDDIMDKSKIRRNHPTVHTIFGEPTAILAGDLLFAKAFEAMLDIPLDPKIYKQLNADLIQCVINICEGQQLDIGFEQQKIIEEKQYLDMIMKKTAVLFGLATKGGAVIGCGTQEEITNLYNYGLYLGLSFQIWDDYLDISSNQETLGKDIGNDIRNGKKTLIAVHSLQHAQNHQKNILNTYFGNRNATEDNIKKVFNIFIETQSIDYAKHVAIKYNNKAKEELEILPDSSAKQCLQDLADYAMKREK